LAVADEVERAHRAIVRGVGVMRRPRTTTAGLPRHLSGLRPARTIAGA
jgi:hypothetical protein